MTFKFLRRAFDRTTLLGCEPAPAKRARTCSSMQFACRLNARAARKEGALAAQTRWDLHAGNEQNIFLTRRSLSFIHPPSLALASGRRSRFAFYRSLFIIHRQSAVCFCALLSAVFRLSTQSRKRRASGNFSILKRYWRLRDVFLHHFLRYLIHNYWEFQYNILFLWQFK